MTDYVVICRNDEGAQPERVPATRQLFSDPAAAGRYAATLAISREAEVFTVSDYLIRFEGWRHA